MDLPVCFSCYELLPDCTCDLCFRCKQPKKFCVCKDIPKGPNPVWHGLRTDSSKKESKT